jgi:hypothetical protein
MAQRETSTQPLDETLKDDLLWGVKGEKGIANFLGRTPRQTKTLIDNGLPVTRHSERLISGSKSVLRQYLTTNPLK